MASKNHLSLPKRGCKFRGMNGRAEFDGDDKKSAADYGISGFMLTRDETNEFFGRDVYARLFDTKKRPPEPAMPEVPTYHITHKFRDSSVSLFFDGESEAVKLACNLAKIEITPQTGGMCELKVQLQSHPSRQEVGILYDNLGRDISASIRFGKLVEKIEAQPELPMDAGESGGARDGNEVPGPLDDEQLGMH